MSKRLLIADDHSLLRQGVRQLLTDEFPEFAFAEADSLDSVLDHLGANPIDLLLMDLGMPGMAGAESLRALREAHPTARIIVVTGVDERSMILDCLAAGVHGYVLKASPVEEIIRAVRMVLAGDIYVASALASIGTERTVNVMRAALPTVPMDTTRFTARQVQVLQLLAQGRSTKDIARILELGPGTVKIHLAAIYRRLNAHNRTEAVVLASKLNL
ncbi:MAG TPA: response regulator transcription factor [Acetobacteraceae bacterium]|jgi:DNA-binding NarL/FixJ family response regulator